MNKKQLQHKIARMIYKPNKGGLSDANFIDRFDELDNAIDKKIGKITGKSKKKDKEKKEE